MTPHPILRLSASATDRFDSVVQNVIEGEPGGVYRHVDDSVPVAGGNPVAPPAPLPPLEELEQPAATTKAKSATLRIIPPRGSATAGGGQHGTTSRSDSQRSDALSVLPGPQLRRSNFAAATSHARVAHRLRRPVWVVRATGVPGEPPSPLCLQYGCIGDRHTGTLARASTRALESRALNARVDFYFSPHAFFKATSQTNISVSRDRL
jgi:hypothetical protein